MDLFALNHEVTALESALTELQGEARLSVLLPLAWHLRQRDCKRALLLVNEAEEWLAQVSWDEARIQACHARLLLVLGEVAWLFAQLDAAEQYAEAAVENFAQLGDRVGRGDGQLLRAALCTERGDSAARDACLQLAQDDYRAAADSERLQIVRAMRLNHAAWRDTTGTAARLHSEFAGLPQPLPPALQAWVSSANALVAAFTGELGMAIKHFLQAHHAAMESGQIRHAVFSASNGADNFASLGDLDAALEWDELALAQAQACGWPGTLGGAQMQTGNVLRLLGRLPEAHAILNEALDSMQALQHASRYSLALQYQGDVALDMGEPAAALDCFLQAETIAVNLGEPFYLLRCWRGQASALGRLGEPEQALSKISAALLNARELGSADEQIKVLRVFAELYQQYALPAPEGMTAASPTLHYLLQALQMASSIKGYILPSDLLDELANAYAATGDAAQARHYGQAAAAARDNKRLDDARNRAMAMQVRQESALARAEAEYHHRLAQAESERAAQLQEASATLETLGRIGREITGSLNTDAVFAALYRHLGQLLDTTSFFVYLLEPGGHALKAAFINEARHHFPSPLISLQDPESLTARCARERCELFFPAAPRSHPPGHLMGPLDTQSMMFSPLLIGDRLLGVMSVQSVDSHAYGEREQSIFRTLSAYAAIALDNAGAYAAAETARQQANAALEALNEARAKLADRAEWLAEEVRKATNQIVQRERETVIRLSKAAEYRDPETGAHILRMAHYSELIARGLGLPVADQELLLEAAPMHDIGKVGITDSILLKPGRLTPEEFEIMKLHASYGYEILKDSSSLVLQAGAAIALGHHEKYDGTGYPQGLQGEAIPIFSRIVAVADVFDALTSERPYKKAWTLEAAAAHIKAHAGSHFDPDCVRVFFEHWDEVLDIRQRFQDED
ncbi:MAG: GGDEF domain-containing protein [Burkholderiales bacterium PBB2]|nr:MAG: GGDEF domain-containing protein [Burkholderiales bacterium PBB2]